MIRITRGNFLGLERRQALGIEGDPHPRAAPRPVEERDLAHMLLDDLLDDREPQARAAHPRGYIRLGQPLAVLGKSYAGIHHVNDQLPVFPLDAQLDTIAGNAVLAAITPAFNGFDAILDDIG